MAQASNNPWVDAQGQPVYRQPLPGQPMSERSPYGYPAASQSFYGVPYDPMPYDPMYGIPVSSFAVPSGSIPVGIPVAQGIPTGMPLGQEDPSYYQEIPQQFTNEQAPNGFSGIQYEVESIQQPSEIGGNVQSQIATMEQESHDGGVMTPTGDLEFSRESESSSVNSEQADANENHRVTPAQVVASGKSNQEDLHVKPESSRQDEVVEQASPRRKRRRSSKHVIEPKPIHRQEHQQVAQEAPASVSETESVNQEAPASWAEVKPANDSSQVQAQVGVQDNARLASDALENTEYDVSFVNFPSTDEEYASGFDQPVLEGAASDFKYPIIQIQQTRKTHGWIVAIVIVLCLFTLMLYSMISCTSMLSSSGANTAVPSSNTVAVIDIDGTIQYDGSANSPEGLAKLLRFAENESGIQAVVLRVNSGGGVATAGEEMASLVRDFSKPIVVSSASMNASAAYEISSQADYIFVSRTTEIGSIGTAFELTDISGLMEMLGIDVEVITSTDSKDSTYGYRALTEEERLYYQRMVNQINEVFIETVATGRGMAIEDVRKLANGMVYSGIDAVNNGLADDFGSREDAIAYAAQLAGLTSYDSFELGYSKSNLGVLEYLL